MVSAEDLAALLWKHILNCHQSRSEAIQYIKIYIKNEPHSKIKLDDDHGILVDRIDDYYLQTREWIPDRKYFCDAWVDENDNLLCTTHMDKAEPEWFETLSLNNMTEEEMNHFMWVLHRTLKDNFSRR